MKTQRGKYTLRWLVTVEDNSSWEAGRMRDHKTYQYKGETIYSISKLLAWYITAIVISVFLSRLH